MSSEVAVRSDVNESITWARTMAPSAMLPKQFQNNPANLLFAAEYADALGISRIHALTEIHVVQGRPTASASLMAALVRKAGHKLRIRSNDAGCEAVLVRADDPDFEYVSRWTLERAKTAGLNTDMWRKYPAAMMRSRAISEVVRQGASEILIGAYTPEELGAQVAEDGTPLQAEPVKSGMAQLKARMEEAASEPEVEVTEVVNESIQEHGRD